VIRPGAYARQKVSPERSICAIPVNNTGLTPTTMVSTPEELITGFLHSSLQKVRGEPTFEDLNIIHRLLNTSAVIVSSYEGRGRHGHLRLIMNNDEYFAVATDVFLPPANQGVAATMVVGVTAAQITETNRVHTGATCVYCTYHNVTQAFKK
jgi:hypothetical protein